MSGIQARPVGAEDASAEGLVLAVVGSRSFIDKRLSWRVLDRVRSKVAAVVTGGAEGADSLGAAWARSKGIPVRIIRPDWKRFGNSAGPRRNAEIVAEAGALIAFWDGASRGTADVVARARASGVPVHVVRASRALADSESRTILAGDPGADHPLGDEDDGEGEPLTVEEMAQVGAYYDERRSYREERESEAGDDETTRRVLETDKPPKTAIVKRGVNLGPPEGEKDRRHGAPLPPEKVWAVDAEVREAFPVSHRGTQLVRLVNGTRVILPAGKPIARGGPIDRERHLLRVKGWVVSKPAYDGRGCVLIVGRYSQVVDSWVPRFPRAAAAEVARVA